MAAKKAKIRFFEDHTVQDEHAKDPEKATMYKKGKVVEVPESTAQHYVERRGLAERVKR